MSRETMRKVTVSHRRAAREHKLACFLCMEIIPAGLERLIVTGASGREYDLCEKCEEDREERGAQ